MNEPSPAPTSDRIWSTYSPGRRTGVVFCGTGAHGAYHAGALRALQEAGVKVDLVAGHGVGAATAMLAAIDGGARLWEPEGLWRSTTGTSFYRWKPLIGIVGWIALALVLVLAAPLVVLAVGFLVYPIGFLLSLFGLSAGDALIATYAGVLQTAFSSPNLPTIVPRLAMFVLGVLVTVSFLGVSIAEWRAPIKRRSRGGWWWRIIASPLDADGARATFGETLWQLIRGADATPRPSSRTLGRRYAEVLTENLGQPGFRELLMVAVDLDTHRDIVAALLTEPYRTDLMTSRPGRDRLGEVLDLTGVSRDHAFDMVAAALTPPLVCDPALLAFASESFWRGETHRLCDRPGSSNRLLEEVAVAGVSQVIIVSAVPLGVAPHALSSPCLDVRHRAGELIAAAERAALRDAIEMARLRFDCVFVISPTHNAIGPFDFAGAYDQSSDRQQTLAELMEHAYEDAYRQFIDPVVGGSGEHLGQVAPERRTRTTTRSAAQIFDDVGGLE